MLSYLFVYGTLKSTHGGRFGRDQRQRLQRDSRLLGPAVMVGRLYDLGRYPGLSDADAPGELVHGEVLELHDPAAAFRWLDAYEGIVPGAPGASEYRRAQRPVQVQGTDSPAHARTLTAWVYIYARDLATARLIADGRWQPVGA